MYILMHCACHQVLRNVPNMHAHVNLVIHDNKATN